MLDEWFAYRYVLGNCANGRSGDPYDRLVTRHSVSSSSMACSCASIAYLRACRLRTLELYWLLVSERQVPDRAVLAPPAWEPRAELRAVYWPSL